MKCKGKNLYIFVPAHWMPAARILHKNFTECLCILPIAIRAQIWYYNRAIGNGTTQQTIEKSLKKVSEKC